MTFLQRPEIAAQTARLSLGDDMGAAPHSHYAARGEVLPFAPHDTHCHNGLKQLESVARDLAHLGPPVIVFNASHSGSRLLATMLERLGVYMGANLNESEDSLDLFELVRYLVRAHAPDYSRLFTTGDPSLRDRVSRAIESHLDGWRPGQPWGWKLPETGHVLPVISRLFPEARCIHLVRDGRDVAFSPFLAPKDPFWRKVYFNAEQIESWRGMGMTQRAYRAHGHLFNAMRWVNSVTLGRAHGVMLGGRYLELRYEQVVADPAGELQRLATFLDLPQRPDMLDSLEVRCASVGKWRRHSARELAEVRGVLEPALASFGYEWETPPPWHAPARSAARLGEAVRGWLSAGQDAEPRGLGGLFRIQARR